MKHHAKLLISSLVVAGSVGCAASADREPAAIPPNAHHLTVQPMPEVQSSQSFSGLHNRDRLVVSDADTWAKLWKQIVAGRQPAPPVPAVDFATSSLVVAAMGMQPTGGYLIRIDDVATLDDELWVS